MIFLECIGSRASLSAIDIKKVYFTITTPGFTFLSVKSGVVIVKYFLLLLRCVPKGYSRHNRE